VTGFYETVPDLVVKVASPGNSYGELNDKALMWLRYGVRPAWVVHPDTRIVDVHCEGYRVLSLSDQDKLDGLEILPGFTCAVTEIFET
jgi:Uma2 family endonuclease